MVVPIAFSPIAVGRFVPLIVLLIASGFFNGIVAHDSFSDGIATWYGSPTGCGTSTGACGFQDDVSKPPYNYMVAAGNAKIFQSGKGCGVCYEVKCEDNVACSKSPITITIADECPTCYQDQFHFDLSGKAFGSLARRGLEEKLRKAGQIKIKYRRVQCHYHTDIKFKLDKGANPYYLAFLVEHMGGDGDVDSVEVLPSNSNGKWITMKRSWGETWKADIPEGVKGPFSVKMKTIKSGKTIIAQDAIPKDWKPGQNCHSKLTMD